MQIRRIFFALLAMFDDIIGYIERLDLRFVSVEQFPADSIRPVGSCGIGNPRYIGSGQQVGIHRVTTNRLFQPLRHASERVVKPYFGDDQFRVKDDDGLRAMGYLLHLFYLMPRDIA